MDNNVTRIADLPDLSTRCGVVGGGGETNYSPMNIHPNPYGNSGPVIPPQQTASQPRGNDGTYPVYPPQSLQPPPPQSQYLSEDQIKIMQQQRLPSRDIPQNTIQYNQDEQVKPNYIPPVSNISSDFVREQEQVTERNLREYDAKKKRENKLDRLVTEFQTPILIAILFFIFQMPLINNMIFKKFSLFSIINDDGHFNITGLLLKSALFGGLYYSVVKSTTFLSEF
jgi:hypothetical protein